MGRSGGGDGGRRWALSGGFAPNKDCLECVQCYCADNCIVLMVATLDLAGATNGVWAQKVEYCRDLVDGATTALHKI